MKKVLITSITDLDGSYISEFLLLHKKHEVNYIKRIPFLIYADRIDYFHQRPIEQDLKFISYYGDLTNANPLIRIVQKVQPEEIYDLEAQKFMSLFLLKSQSLLTIIYKLIGA